MNYFTMIPREMVWECVSHCTYRYLRAFGCTCFDHYAQLDKWIKLKQKQTKGFPRLDGRCRQYTIPQECIDHVDIKTSIHLANTMDLGLDIVKGDVIEFIPQRKFYGDDRFAIYNGEVFEETGYMTDGDPYLLEHYTVIENDVPINYYENVDCNIHFNFTAVKSECVDNLQYQQEHQWKTHFIFDHRHYTILCEVCNHRLDIEQERCLCLKFLNGRVHPDEICFSIHDTLPNTLELEVFELPEYTIDKR